MKKSKLFFGLAILLIMAIMTSMFVMIPTSAASGVDISWTGLSYGYEHIFGFTADEDVDLSTLIITYNEGGWTPDLAISSSNALDAEWLTLDVDASNPDVWKHYTYSGAVKSLPKGTVYVKLINSGKIAQYQDGSAIPTRFYCDYSAYIPEPTPADGEIVYLSTKADGSRIYKMAPAKDMDLATLSIKVNVSEQNWGHFPILSIATSKDSAEWIELTRTSNNEWWGWYGYSGDIEYLPAGPIYIKVSSSGAGCGCAITQPSYTYSEYVPEPTPADKEILPTGKMIGNAYIWKTYAEKDVDLSTLRLTYNEGGWTPEIAISKTNSADAEWVTLDVDAGSSDGWRYYTYSGAEKFLEKGAIYIKVLNTAKIAQYGDASVNPTNFTSEYEGYVELGDGDVVVSYYRGPGNTVHRADAANDVNLNEFKFICNVNDWNGGWTPAKIYIANSLASDAVWYELDCTYSDVTTTNYGWRHYTYSGDDVTLEAGTFFIKLGASGKGGTDSDFITQSYYTYSNQSVGDIHEDGKIDILDLVRAKKIFAAESFDYMKALDMNHNADNATDDLILLRQFLLQYL